MKKIFRQQNGSAGVEFVLAGAFMALLIYTTLNFFWMINQATENHLQARYQAFAALEGLEDVAHCLDFPINEEREMAVTISGPPRDYYFLGNTLHNPEMRQTVTAWVGHRKDCCTGTDC